MDNAVISDKLTELLKNRKVKAAVFTTYTFEIDFFELEVVPLLLNNDTTYSTDERVKIVQVHLELQKAKAQTPMPLEVFYDEKLFRNQALVRTEQQSPRMEYLCHGVDLGNSAFHSKVAFILVEDNNYVPKTDCLLVGAGSNNLSYAGWWKNIECQHWEEVWGSRWGDHRNSHQAFLRQLHKDIKYLQGKRRSGLDEESDAIGKISDFLNKECRGQYGIKFAYYGLNPKDRFQPFLKKSVEALLPKWYQSWNLEIISPFFAENTKNREHDFFLKKLGVKKISILLPKSQDGKALCKSEYYDHIKDENEIYKKEIYWAKWESAIEKKLNAKDRRLHAKVYHFYNKKQSWVFVGSVNFTHKAMGGNVEAGFFTKLTKAGPLLEPLDGDPAGFDVPKEMAPGNEHEDENPIPQIYLAYDWAKKELRGQTKESKGACINIHLPEGGNQYAIRGWEINNKECHYEGETEALENLLKNTSLVKVSVSDHKQSNNDPFLVLLQETGWIHKPLDLAHLSVQEILQLYADINNSEGLMKAIEDAKTRELVLKGTAGEFLKTDDGPETRQFFCDYAQIFHAFGELKKRLSESDEENGDSKQIEYYLTGNAPDSLPTLIQLAKLPKTNEIKEGEKASKDDNGQDPVLSYLSLLCCKEIYKEIYEGDKSSKRPFLAKEQLEIVQEQRKKVDKYIDECRSKIELEKDNTSDRRERFLRWFEEQFFTEYKPAKRKNEAGTA